MNHIIKKITCSILLMCLLDFNMLAQSLGQHVKSASGHNDSARYAFMDQVQQQFPRTQIPASPHNYVSENVRFFSKETGLWYGATLTLPHQKASCPTVVLISGTGQQDRDYTGAGHKFFWVLADYLSNHGIGVLRIDDRGTGETEGIYQRANSHDFAQDIYAGVTWLQSRPEIDKRRIGLIGHSEGAVIAPMVFKMDTTAFSFLVLLCGPTAGLREVNRKQARDYFQSAFKDDAALLEQYMKLHTQVLDLIPDSINNYEGLTKYLAPVSARMFRRESERKLASRIGITADSVTSAQVLAFRFNSYLSPWWTFILPYDFADDLKKIHVPVLSIYGTTDQQILPFKSMQVLKSNLPANRYSRVKMVRHMNHFLQPDKDGNPSGYQSNPVTIRKDVLKIIANWINHIPSE